MHDIKWLAAYNDIVFYHDMAANNGTVIVLLQPNDTVFHHDKAA